LSSIRVLLEDPVGALRKGMRFLPSALGYAVHRFKGNDEPVEVTICGVKCKFMIRGIDDYYMIHPKTEKWAWKYINVPKEGVFVDVGSHIGKFTVPIAKMGANVISIEPHPGNFKMLVKNIKLNKVEDKVIPMNIALSDENTEGKLYIGVNNLRHSIVENYGKGSIKVTFDTLDDIVKNIGVNRIDFIKIDVEGSELNVIKGGLKSINKFKPNMIIEVRKCNLKRLKKMLLNVGYSVEIIEEAKCEYGEDPLYVYASYG